MKEVIEKAFNDFYFETNHERQHKIFNDVLRNSLSMSKCSELEKKRLHHFLCGMLDFTAGIILNVRARVKEANKRFDDAIKEFLQAYSKNNNSLVQKIHDDLDYLDVFVSLGEGLSLTAKANRHQKDLEKAEKHLKVLYEATKKKDSSIVSCLTLAHIEYSLGRCLYLLATQYEKNCEEANEWLEIKKSEEIDAKIADQNNRDEKEAKKYKEKEKNRIDTIIKKYEEAIKYFDLARIDYAEAVEPKIDDILLQNQFICALNSLGDAKLKLARFDAVYYKQAFVDYLAVFQNVVGRWEPLCTNLNKYLTDEYLTNKASLPDNIEDFLTSNRVFVLVINGIGNYYREMGHFYRAIELYELAVKADKNFAYPYNYLGDCYLVFGDYKNAIHNYKMACEMKPNSAFGFYGLGKTCYELGKISYSVKFYDLAIDFFKQALTRDPYFGYVYLDYARVLSRKFKIPQKQSDGAEVKKNYMVALSLLNNEYRKEYIKNCVKEFQDYERVINDVDADSRSADKESKVNKQKEIENEEAEKEEAERRLKKVMAGTLTKGIEEQVFLNSKRFYDFLMPNIGSNNRKDGIVLEVLRRWNSYTPIVTGGRGGGYFLSAFGRGIVIDPGFNFIDNFIKEGHLFSDINDVLLTHSHDDHTADVESIINLLYRYNKCLSEDFIPRLVAKATNSSKKEIIKLMAQADNGKSNSRKELIDRVSQYYIDKSVDEGERKARKVYKKINIFMPSQVGAKFDRLFDNNEYCRPHSVCLLARKEIMNDQKIPFLRQTDFGEFEIYPLYSKHKDVAYAKWQHLSLGYAIDFSNLGVVIVFTGDTGWDKKIEKEYSSWKKSKWQDRKIILVAHIGGFKDHEWYYVSQKNDSTNHEDFYYQNHLGRLGLCQMMSTLKPDICLISEFGEEFRGLRAKIANLYKEAFPEPDRVILPADIGLKIYIEKENAKVVIKIQAITAVDHYNKIMTYEKIPYDQVDYDELPSSDQLFYFKKNISIESQCIEGLQNNYKITGKENLQNFQYEDLYRIYEDVSELFRDEQHSSDSVKPLK